MQMDSENDIYAKPRWNNPRFEQIQTVQADTQHLCHSLLRKAILFAKIDNVAAKNLIVVII